MLGSIAGDHRPCRAAFSTLIGFALLTGGGNGGSTTKRLSQGAEHGFRRASEPTVQLVARYSSGSAFLEPLLSPNRPTLHHKINPLQSTHIGQRVARHRDNIGELPHFNRAYLILHSHQL